MGDVVSSHSGVVVIDSGVPCLSEQSTGFVDVARELCLGSFDAELGSAASEIRSTNTVPLPLPTFRLAALRLDL